MNKKFLLIFFFSLVVLATQAQNTYTLKGKVIDAQTKEGLWGAHVIPDCKDGSVGAVCDEDGSYILTLKSAECNVNFHFLGYETITKTVSFKGVRTMTINIELATTAQLKNGVEVTAQRYEMKRDESVSSIEYVGSKYIQDNNITSLDDAFDQVGGLVIVDNEPQMRGGSGFSSGMGSRVMIMMDEMPVMRVDAGRPAWNLIPMENIEQIEILKGASSVLYGSSAITGAINVRTAYPKGKPETKVSLYTGMYSRPKVDYRCSWEKGTVPLTGGFSVSHARKIKKLDLVLSVEYAHDDGFVNYCDADSIASSKASLYEDWMHGSSSFDFDDTSKYEKLVKENRVRANFGTRYNVNENMSFGLNGNFMYSKNVMTHFWLNADNGMYNVYPGSVTKMRDIMFFVDPFFKYYAKNDQVHSLKARIMYSNNFATGDQDSRSEMYYLEYQYAKKFKKAGNLQLFTGAVGQFARSQGNVFSGVSILDTGQPILPKYSGNGAVYVQLEKKFLRQENLTLLAGGRYEYYQIFEEFGHFLSDPESGNYVEAKPVFRAGINYNIVRSFTFFRASFGQGYRFPSIGERYLTTKVGIYGFYPNPDLLSETSWNVEFGVQQMFKLLGFKGCFDIAWYYQKYNNYVEFFLGPWLTAEQEPKPFYRYGFKFFNTGQARIMGVDANIAGEGNIGKKVKYTLYFAYSYTNPKVIDTNKIFTSTMTNDYCYMNTSSDTNGQIMKYRIEHMLKLDFNFKFFDLFSVGMNAQYYSLMKNVDNFFYTMDRFNEDAPRSVINSRQAFPFDGLQAYRESHRSGTWVWGLTANVELWNIKLSVLVSNLFNKEYSLRPMCPEAPRLTTIQLVYKFVEGEPAFPKRKH